MCTIVGNFFLKINKAYKSTPLWWALVFKLKLTPLESIHYKYDYFVNNTVRWLWWDKHQHFRNQLTKW